MTVPTTSEPSPVRVHIVKSDVQNPPAQTKKETSRTLGSAVLSGNDPVNTSGQAVRLVGNAPGRSRVTLTITGNAGVVAYLCASQGDAQNRQGAIVQAGQVIDYESTEELWIGAANGVVVTVGIIQEF